MEHFILFFSLLIGGFLFALLFGLISSKHIEKFSLTPSTCSLKSEQLCEKILSEYSIKDVIVRKISKQNKFTLSQYNNETKVITLSEKDYGSNSILGIAMAAHETMHAVQHEQKHPILTFMYHFNFLATSCTFIVLPCYMIFYLFISDENKKIFPFYFNVCYILLILYHVFTVVWIEGDANIKAYQYLKNKKVLTDCELKLIKKIYISSFFGYLFSSTYAIFMTKK